MTSEGIIELKDFDTLFISGHITTPFCISWSEDNKVALLVDDGIQIFELYPTPVSDQLSITFLRSWIPVNSNLPFQNFIVDNKSNSFVWKNKIKSVYELALDSTLTSVVETSTVSAIITQCSFSPLICNESYFSCLTNNGVLQIYKWNLQKWEVLLDVSKLWISHYQHMNCSEEVDFDILKTKLMQLKITTMIWSDSPQLFFITGHEDGGICIWTVTAARNGLTLNVKHYFHIIGKPTCLSFCKGNNSETYLLIIGTLLGTVKSILFKFSEERKSITCTHEIEIWSHKDLIKPSFIKSEIKNEIIYIFTVKNNVILIQMMEVNAKNEMKVISTNWHEFSAPVVGLNNYEMNYIIATRSHDFFRLVVDESGLSIKNDVDLPLKPMHSTCFHCYGLAMSKNKAIWLAASSAKVNYDSKTMKDTINILIFTPKIKFFKSLSDSTSNGLIKKITEKYKSTRLTEISDLLEIKKCELLADPSGFTENANLHEGSSPLELKLMIWEAKLKMFTQSVDAQSIVAHWERLLALQWCLNKKQSYLQTSVLTSLQRHSLEVINELLKKTESGTSSGNQCAICGEIAPAENTKFSSCSNLHIFPRCCLSFLPCDSIPYAFCRLCDSTALIDFKMKFLKAGSSSEECRRVKRNNGRKSGISCLKDGVSEMKLKLRIRRTKANARERNRMHGLNNALDRLRSTLPIKTLRTGIGVKHKLSKIETLKIACNYIQLLMNILKSNQEIEINTFATSLALGLSHSTANVIVSSFSQVSKYCYSSQAWEQNSNFFDCESSVEEDWSKYLST